MDTFFSLGDSEQQRVGRSDEGGTPLSVIRAEVVTHEILVRLDGARSAPLIGPSNTKAR
jgi:hypothetical protein